MRPSMATLIYPFCLKSSFIQDYVSINGRFNLFILSEIINDFMLFHHLSKIMRPLMAALIYPFCLKSSFIQDYAAIDDHFNLSILSEIIIYPRLCGHRWPL